MAENSDKVLSTFMVAFGPAAAIIAVVYFAWTGNHTEGQQPSELEGANLALSTQPSPSQVNPSNGVRVINGREVECRPINTTRWGHPETYNADWPTIDTPRDAIAALGLDYDTATNIYVIQGDKVKPYVSTDVFANGSSFCRAQ